MDANYEFGRVMAKRVQAIIKFIENIHFCIRKVVPPTKKILIYSQLNLLLYRCTIVHDFPYILNKKTTTTGPKFCFYHFNDWCNVKAYLVFFKIAIKDNNVPDKTTSFVRVHFPISNCFTHYQASVYYPQYEQHRVNHSIFMSLGTKKTSYSYKYGS